MSRRWLQLYLVVAVSLGVAWIFSRIARDMLIDFARVTNESMLPYLAPGQRLVISRLSPCLHLPFRHRGVACQACDPGSAYVFRPPGRGGPRLVKFAVSKEEFDAGSARISSGDIISFTPRTPAESQLPETGRPVCYFVGSNGERSVDSRHFGPVPADEVEGRVVYP
ncbi:MAG: S26 family signal peptidase [Spirochaetota bacterium]